MNIEVPQRAQYIRGPLASLCCYCLYCVVIACTVLSLLVLCCHCLYCVVMFALSPCSGLLCFDCELGIAHHLCHFSIVWGNDPDPQPHHVGDDPRLGRGSTDPLPLAL
jgi:hypothetical protein